MSGHKPPLEKTMTRGIPQSSVQARLSFSAEKDSKGKRKADFPGDEYPLRSRPAPSSLSSIKPLAERVRPTSLIGFIGQRTLMGGSTSVLRSLIQRDSPVTSMIFWGPPGSGKTTVARIIAKTTSSHFKEMSATDATTADLRKVFEEAANMLTLTGRRTILFIDEIQRFNKLQQDSFLPVLESGLITMIASTTENPSFRLNNALLSRCRTFTFQKLDATDIVRILKRAMGLIRQEERAKAKREEKEREALQPKEVEVLDIISSDDEETGSTEYIKPIENPAKPATSPLLSTQTEPSSSNAGESSNTQYRLFPEPIDDDLLAFISGAADGDARVALTSLELALSVIQSDPSVSKDELKAQLRRAHMQYDRSGDHHYDTISALHKAVRGGDANAALYWLARMLEGGDDPLFVARRLVRMASEDIGLANPDALPQAVSAYDATQRLGMPECDCILAQTVVMLAESPKSVRTYKAYNLAKALVKTREAYPVPMHIRNAPTKMMKDLGYGYRYKYNPDFAHPVWQTYLPSEVENDAKFLEQVENHPKQYDPVLLREWEVNANNGKKWEPKN